MKGIYILFSGGYDSSFLINCLLQELDSNKETNIEVNLISVDATFLGSKANREKEARNKLLNYWKAKYFAINIIYSELRIDINTFSVKSQLSGLVQPQFWLSSLLTAIDLVRYDEVDILFSYILGDQALYYRHEIEDICRKTIEISFTTKYLPPRLKHADMPKIDIRFPLAFIEKHELLSMLIYDDLFVFENSTSCEDYSSEEDLCGKCIPCKHLKQALNTIANSDNIDEKVKSISNNYLNKFNDKKEHDEEYNIVDEREEKIDER